LFIVCCLFFYYHTLWWIKIFKFKNVTFFHSKLLLDSSAGFTSSRTKALCQKWKVKPIFRGAYRLSRTGIVECLEWKSPTRGVIRNSLMAWPDWPWPPYFTTDLRHCLLHSVGRDQWRGLGLSVSPLVLLAPHLSSPFLDHPHLLL